jgi:hypothetical protein
MWRTRSSASANKFRSLPQERVERFDLSGPAIPEVILQESATIECNRNRARPAGELRDAIQCMCKSSPPRSHSCFAQEKWHRCDRLAYPVRQFESLAQTFFFSVRIDGEIAYRGAVVNREGSHAPNSWQ